MTSRLCVKNLPKHCDDKRLLALFEDAGQITDCKVVKTKDGKSRQFGFVGFRTVDQAHEAKEKYDKSYMDTAKLKIEFAREVGSESLERPWSKYSQGSSRNQKLLKQQEGSQGGKKRNQEQSEGPQKGNKRQKGTPEEENDPQLKEFLAVMQPRSQKALWANDDAVLTQAVAAAPSKPAAPQHVAGTDDDSDDEDVFDASKSIANKRGTKRQRATQQADVLPHEESDEEPDGAPEGPPPEELQSDDAYLRSKRKATFSDDDEDFAVEGDSEGEESEGGDSEFEGGPGGTADGGESESDLTDMHEDGQDGQMDVQDADPPQEGAEAAGMVDGRGMAPDVSDTGRLFVRNLAYSVTEEELRECFERFGDLQEVHLVLDKHTGKSKGLAYVQYAMPADAVEAAQKLDATIFMGRLLHVLPARTAPATAVEKAAKETGRPSTFKQQRESERKADAGNRAAWNTLFMRQDTVAEAVAAHYGLSKSQLLDREAADLPLRMALGETHVIAATKKELGDAGIDVEKLEAAAAASGKASATTNVARSSTALLVKNLPYSATQQELEELLGGPGGLARLVLPSTRTMAVVEYLEPQDARRAFKTLAYRRCHHVPIYLEWAPKDIFAISATAAATAKTHKQAASTKPTAGAQGPPEGPQGGTAGAGKGASVVVTGVADAEMEDAVQESSTIYVKNLNWSTVDERLRAHFEGAAKGAGGVLRSAKISRKKGPKGDILSMGFGFVECSSEAVAQAVIRRLQGSKLDGHELVLQLSKKQPRASVNPFAPPTPAKSAPCSKVVVRNVAFEATRKDIFGLFTPFGHVKSCRLPKKFDGTPRGFAFVEMSSKQEAKNAMEGLLGTHLYGRRLVLEWAADDESLEGLRAKTAAKYHDDSMQAAVARGKKQAVERE